MIQELGVAEEKAADIAYEGDTFLKKKTMVLFNIKMVS
jgi:hypothetical protein